MKQKNEKKKFDVRVNRVSSLDARTILRKPGKSKLSKVRSKASSAIMALSIVALSTLAGMGAASPANALDIIDTRNSFCTTGAFGYEIEKRELAPTTKNAEGITGRNGLGSPNQGTTAASSFQVGNKDKVVQDSTKATAYERYGMSGTTWTTWLGPDNPEGLKGDGQYGGKSIIMGTGMLGVKDKDRGLISQHESDVSKYPHFYNQLQSCQWGTIWTTNIANQIFDISKWITSMSNTIFETAYDGDILKEMIPKIETILDKLWKKLYIEPVVWIMFATALTIAITGIIKKQYTKAVQESVWFICALTVGLTIVANPLMVYNYTNKIFDTAIGISASVLRIDPNDDPNKETTVSNLCEATPQRGESASATSVREFGCYSWYQNVYTPWVIGQFGSMPGEGNEVAKNGYAVNPNITGGVKMEIANQPDSLPATEPIDFNGNNYSKSWSIYHLDNKVIKTDTYAGMTPEDRKKQAAGLMNITIAQLHSEGMNNPSFAGKNGGERIQLAATSSIAATAHAAVTITFSITLIIIRIFLYLLTLFIVPLVLLISVNPTVGRRILFKFIELILSLIIRGTIISLLLSLMVLIFGFISNVQFSNWVVSSLMTVIIALAFLLKKEEIMRLFEMNLNLQSTDTSVSGVMKATGADKVARQVRTVTGNNQDIRKMIFEKAAPRKKATAKKTSDTSKKDESTDSESKSDSSGEGGSEKVKPKSTKDSSEDSKTKESTNASNNSENVSDTNSVKPEKVKLRKNNDESEMASESQADSPEVKIKPVKRGSSNPGVTPENDLKQSPKVDDSQSNATKSPRVEKAQPTKITFTRGAPDPLRKAREQANAKQSDDKSQIASENRSASPIEKVEPPKKASANNSDRNLAKGKESDAEKKNSALPPMLPPLSPPPPMPQMKIKPKQD